jgi:hypothetical protein
MISACLEIPVFHPRPAGESAESLQIIHHRKSSLLRIGPGEIITFPAQGKNYRDQK